MAVNLLSSGGQSISTQAKNNGQGFIKTAAQQLTPKTPQGSVSQAVVAGRADPVPSSNVSTNNSYYTTYSGTNRTAVDSQTGKAVGTAASAYNTPAYVPPSGGSDTGSKGSSTTTSAAQSVPISVYDGKSTDDIVNEIKRLLQEQEQASKDYYDTWLAQTKEKNRQDYEASRNGIIKNFMLGQRYLKEAYGDGNISGRGLSNQARNYQNMQSNLAQNRQNYINNDSTAQAQRDQGIANAASTLAQGWYNYVLPVQTNRQIAQDNLDLDWRKYLASLNL